MEIAESKEENEIFDTLKIYFPDLKKQLQLGQYFYDIYLDDKIIEFNGDYWHGNPDIYNFDDIIRVSKTKCYTACDLWAKDFKKKQLAESYGYDVLIIWESEFNENKSEVLSRCFDFLKKEII